MGGMGRGFGSGPGPSSGGPRGGSTLLERFSPSGGGFPSKGGPSPGGFGGPGGGGSLMDRFRQVQGPPGPGPGLANAPGLGNTPKGVGKRPPLVGAIASLLSLKGKG